MRKIIFLDFDGVLHPKMSGTFSQVCIFEEFVEKMPNVEIVITSTWRKKHSLDELKMNFTLAVRDRIVGITPVLEDGYDFGGRQREIQSYLDAAGLHSANCYWIALDDMAMFFENNYPNLILTDARKGFTHDDGNSLLEWYKSTLKLG